MNDVPETTDTPSTEPIISDPNYDPLQIESSYKANAKIIKEQALRQQILTGNDPNKKKGRGQRLTGMPDVPALHDTGLNSIPQELMENCMRDSTLVEAIESSSSESELKEKLDIIESVNKGQHAELAIAIKRIRTLIDNESSFDEIKRAGLNNH